MSNEPTRTDLPTGDFISENAVRAVLARRRSNSPTTPGPTGHAVPADPAEGTARPPGATRRLRRWSVAELIARSIAPPPSTT